MSMSQDQISAWIQEVDFDIQEYDDLKRPALLQVFREIDWDKRRQQFFDTGSEECPPGFGVNIGKKVFHLYTFDSDSWELLIKLPREGKIFWVFPKSLRQIEVSVPDSGVAEKLLLLFVDGNDQQLIEACSDL